MIENIRLNLDKNGIQAQINGRAKHYYSIYRKMKYQKKQIDEMGSTQISMDEATIKAEREATQKELNDAKNRIRLLEGQVRSLEAKLQPMQNRR